MIKRKLSRVLAVGGLMIPLLLPSCTDEPVSFADAVRLPDKDFRCTIPERRIVGAGPGKDGIPALTDPVFVRAGEPSTGYLKENDRVVGFHFARGPVAIPLNIFWWHEIVNLDGYGPPFSITHCPLTGSSMGFDRSNVGAEFGVSGLLYQNNLLMYDRNGDESLWPQMLRGARCGSRGGQDLPMVPVIEMTWRGWRTLYPETFVVSGDTGFESDYTQYPYGDYDVPSDPFTLFPIVIDQRRPPKERVLGIPSGSGGLAFPFGMLNEMGAIVALSVDFEGGEVVVFWNRFRAAAMAYEPFVGQDALKFNVVQGRITDDLTGSLWTVDGLAVEGPLAGQRLRPIPEAFVAFWFAWPEFYPEIEIWTDGLHP